jgi:hypothetical protein
MKHDTDQDQGGLEMNYKFTSDGRKVVVIGALNATETIVQEVFVTDGTEFPAGEHFIVKTLLDAPAETYKVREERKLLENIKKLENERDKLSKEIDDFRFYAKAAAAKIKWIEQIDENEVRTVFDNIKSMIRGDYTHVVFPDPVEIKVWGPDLFSIRDGYHRNQFESLRLISLFGEWNGRLSMSWKVNTYRDGSGGATKIIPCKSLQEAIFEAKEIIYSKEHLSDNDFEFCLKYAISVDKIKNTARIERKKESIERQIAQRKTQILELVAELEAIPKIEDLPTLDEVRKLFGEYVGDTKT